MAMAKKNATSKALQSHMAKEKKVNPQTLLEWELACNTNNQRGHVYDQSEINSLYARDSWNGASGATKTCHLISHTGEKFQYVVVKRHQTGGYIDEHANNPDTKQTGNQLIDEVDCWQEYADTEYSDLLCPVLKYFTSKSDKVSAISETMQRNVVIIAQKAVYVDDAWGACCKAAELNEDNGYQGEDADTRYENLKAFSRRQHWRDAMRNPGNSGVIFDYAKGCYKAVFIDYALQANTDRGKSPCFFYAYFRIITGSPLYFIPQVYYTLFLRFQYIIRPVYYTQRVYYTVSARLRILYKDSSAASPQYIIQRSAVPTVSNH